MIDTESLPLSHAVLRLIAELDEFKGSWSALSRLAPERLNVLRRVATIESVASSTRIEGCRLTDREVEALLSSVNIGHLADRDSQEVVGYAEVMETVFESFESIHPTEIVIKQLHGDLLKLSGKDARHRGTYKAMPNSVEAFGAQGESLGIIFSTASPFETPGRMAELIAWLAEANEQNELHPLLRIAVFTVVFLEIHPVQDGNGRLSRVLTTLLLLRAGYSYVPYSSLESVIEQSKDHYYLALRQTQRTIRTGAPDWEPWITFFLHALQQQKERLRIKIERERDQLARLPALSIQILDHVKDHGRASITDLAAATSTSRNTIKVHLRQLVNSNHLTRHGAGRGTDYTLS